MNKLLCEYVGIKEVSAPADLNAAAVVGNRIDMSKGFGYAVKLHFGDSTAAVVTPSFQQHDSATGGVSKDLNVQVNYYHKADGETSFTKVEVRPDSPLGASVDLAGIFADAGGIVVFEFLPEMLDVNNGFNYLSANVADATVAKVMAGSYLISDMKKEGAYLEAL